MAAFDISAFAKESDVLSINTAAQGFEMVRLELIDPNPLNFFPVEDDLTDLMESIQVSGLMQPLVVCRADGGRYRVIAGHRRRAALLKLHESDPKRWGLVACHVLPKLSPAMEELILIQTNTMARELSYQTKTEAVKRTEAALKRYQEETGAALPGRMRSRVAELLKMSEAAIARVKAIDKNLIPALKEAGLTESQAYAAQQLAPEVQECLLASKKLKDIPSYAMETWAKAYKKWADSIGRGCRHDRKAICSHGERVTAAFAATTDQYKCVGSCCCDCGAACGIRCELSRKRLADFKAKERAEKEAETARLDNLKGDIETLVRGVWTRIGEAMRITGVTAEHLAKAIKGKSIGYCAIRASDIEAFIRNAASVDITSHIPRLEMDAMQWHTLAETLGCGLDWLLGRGPEYKTSLPDVPNKRSYRTNFDSIKELTPEACEALYGTADVLEAKTPDEAADIIARIMPCDETCPAFEYCDECFDKYINQECTKILIDWLNLPEKEDD